MKKYFLYFALMGFMAFGAVSCSSDDDDSSSKTELPEAKYPGQAVQFSLSTPLEAAQSGTQSAALSAVNITESGKAIFEVATDGSNKYVTTDVAINGDVYTVSGNATGTITRVASKGTRAESPAQLEVNVKFSKVAELGSLEFKTAENEYAPATAVTTSSASNQATKKLTCTSWKMLGTVIDLEGDVSLFKQFDGGNLAELRDEAIRQGAELSDDEKAMFDKSIVSVDFDDTLLSINYSNGTSDVATWRWANSSYDKINFTFKELDMGNKFIPSENCTADVAFKDNRLNLVIYAEISGNKNYKAKLTLRLQAAN